MYLSLLTFHPLGISPIHSTPLSFISTLGFNPLVTVVLMSDVRCSFDIDETPRTVGISNYSGMISGSYKIVKCNTLTNPKFIYYNYLSIDDVKGLRPYYTGLRKVVRTETFLNLKVRVPPLQEQQQISDYLDYKISRIDTHIEQIFVSYSIPSTGYLTNPFNTTVFI
jgi:hypothetical protein